MKILDGVEKGLVNGKGRAVSRTLLEETLHELEGDIASVADRLGLDYIPLNHHIYKDYRLRDICLGYRQSLVDMAEGVVRGELRQRSFKAAKFVLSTLGKDRGYVPKTESQSTQIVHKTESKMDLTKLSPEKLRQLRGLVEEANQEPVTIDQIPDE